MVYERVELMIKPGTDSAFEEAMRLGCTLLASAKGCSKVSLAKGIENPSKYLLLLEWTEISAHEDFTKTQEFQKFREIAGPFFLERPSMEHFSPRF